MPVEQPLTHATQPGNGGIVVFEQLAHRGNFFDLVGPEQHVVRVAEEFGDQFFNDFLQGFRLLPQGICLAAQFVEFFVDFVERRFVFHEGSPVKFEGLQIGRLPAHCNDAG